MSEIFGIRSPSQEEVEIPRTENLDNLLDPNQDSDLDKWELGKDNARDSVLSNMISSKLAKSNSFNISEILEVLDKHYTLLFSLMEKVIDKLLGVKSK